MRRSLRGLVPLLTLLSLSLPGGVSAQSAGELVFHADDFSFEGPSTAPSGRTAVRLVNGGTELHHIQFIRLDAGRTVDDLLAAFGAGDFYPDWAHDAGGPNVALPGGGEFTAVVDLKPGFYAVLCMIPSPDGVLHLAKGMMSTMTVTEAPAPDPVPQAEPDITLTLVDYGFAFSEAVTPGTHRIAIETQARQSHEFVVFRLQGEASSADLLAWLEGGQQGPPPGMPLGGIAALAPGESNEITLTFEPGRYAFICFIPDIENGAPHFVHGMIQDYEVR